MWVKGGLGQTSGDKDVLGVGRPEEWEGGGGGCGTLAAQPMAGRGSLQAANPVWLLKKCWRRVQSQAGTGKRGICACANMDAIRVFAKFIDYFSGLVNKSAKKYQELQALLE